MNQAPWYARGVRGGSAERLDCITAPDRYTVVFRLNKPNARFHALFTVRWNAMWMMQKHVFEKSGRPPDKRVIAQLSHQLDIVRDTSPEGMFTNAMKATTHA